MATAQLSTVDIWRGDIRHATLLHNEARKKAEPYALWERESRFVFVSEVQEMPIEQLRILADDMRIAAASLNSAISTESVVLAGCPQEKPMVAHDIKRKIRRLVTRKEGCKYVMCEAIRCIKNLNIEANKPRNKSKASKPKGRPRLMEGYGDDEHLSFQRAQKKLNHIKLRILFESLRSSIGKDVIGKLEAEASTAAIKPFTEWAKENGLQEEFVDHIVASELRAMAMAVGADK